jgi:hypothetical protein
MNDILEKLLESEHITVVATLDDGTEIHAAFNLVDEKALDMTLKDVLSKVL